jgi:hypothetical protein
MFVGAPRRNDTTKEEAIQPGVLLECPLKKQCTQFSFNAGNFSVIHFLNLFSHYIILIYIILGTVPRGDEIETHSMLGLAQDVYDGRFVVRYFVFIALCYRTQ